MSSAFIQFKHHVLRCTLTGCTAMLALNAAVHGQLMQEEDGADKYPYPETINELPVIREALPWWAWALMGLAATGVLALILWAIFRKRSAKPVRQPDPKKVTLQKLKALQEQVDTLSVSEAAHQVSVIIREYQQGVYLVPAPYRTSQELYENGPRQTHEQARVKFGRIADFLDKLTFAPQPASTFEVKKLIEEAMITVESNTPPPLMLLGTPAAAASSAANPVAASPSASRPPATPPPLPAWAAETGADAEAAADPESTSVTVQGNAAAAVVRTESNGDDDPAGAGPAPGRGVS